MVKLKDHCGQAGVEPAEILNLRRVGPVKCWSKPTGNVSCPYMHIRASVHELVETFHEALLPELSPIHDAGAFLFRIIEYHKTIPILTNKYSVIH